MKLPIPQDWNGEEWCNYAICWPSSESWEAILRGLITLPMRGRTWDEKTGSILETKTIGADIALANLPLRSCLMPCNDEVLQSIANSIALVASAIRSNPSACCDNNGSGGAPNTDPPFSPTEQGNPNTDDPPEGYDDWEEFFAQKCWIAKDIVDKIQLDLGNLALANFGNISLTGLASLIALAFATPIPFDDIVAIAGLLLAVVAEIVIATTLSLLNDNEEELVCELYNGVNANDSHDRYMSRFIDIVDNAGIDPVESAAIKAIMKYFVNSQNVNRLYVYDDSLNYPPADCECEECQTILWEFVDNELEGWSASDNLPECFGLPEPPLATIFVETEILTITGELQNNSYKGAIQNTGIEFLANSGWKFRIRIERLITEALYIDVVVVTEEENCYWTTIDNNFTGNGFQTLETTIPEADGETITEVYLYISGHVNDPGMQARLAWIELSC